MAECEHLRVERDGAVATVTFNRSRKANALHHAHLAEIEAAALSFGDDLSAGTEDRAEAIRACLAKAKPSFNGNGPQPGCIPALAAPAPATTCTGREAR